MSSLDVSKARWYYQGLCAWGQQVGAGCVIVGSEVLRCSHVERLCWMDFFELQICHSTETCRLITTVVFIHCR